MRFSGFFLLLNLLSICVFSQNLPKDTWKIVSVDSEEKNDNEAGLGFASCIIDNNINTYWTTKYKTAHTPFPHHIVIDLGSTAHIKGFVLYPRQKYLRARISNYNLYTSLDNLHWELIHKDKFRYMDFYDYSPQRVTLKKQCRTRYIKFEVVTKLLEEYRCVHLAEMDIQGIYTNPMIFPRIHMSSDTVLKNEVIQFTDSSFSQNTKILSRQWHFPGGSPSSSNEPNPKVEYRKCGVYPISLTIISKGKTKKTLTLPNAVYCLPAPAINPSNQWKLTVSEQEAAMESDSAKRMIDKKPFTKWHTRFFSGKKLPHFIIIDLGEKFKINGIGYLPRQEGSINGIFSSYRIFVTNDTLDWGKEVCRVTEPKPYRSLRINEFPEIKGRYLKIVIDKTFPTKSNFASASELYIYGETSKQPLAVWIISALGFAGLLIGFLIRKTSKKEEAPQATQQPDIDLSAEKAVKMYLFGRFTLQNNDRNVEQLFYKIKQLLALITYYTIDQQGISTGDLNRLLWSELPQENVSNARSSGIKKLRTALDNVPDIQIVIEDKIWKIQLPSNNVYIDFTTYREISGMLVEMLKKREYSETLLNNYLSIIERGRFLDDFETDWADDLKNKISEEIIDMLRTIVTTFSEQLTKKLKIRMSDCLFLQDELNVEALRMRLQLYCEESNLGLAKKTYDAFSRKYRMIYNEDFPTDFTKLLQE